MSVKVVAGHEDGALQLLIGDSQLLGGAICTHEFCIPSHCCGAETSPPTIPNIFFGLHFINDLGFKNTGVSNVESC